MTNNYKIITQERMNNSLNGNPRYRFVLENIETGEIVTCSTKPDYNFVYGVLNNAPMIYDAEIKATKTGRVYMYNARTSMKKENEK